jgi:hypothetical protein
VELTGKCYAGSVFCNPLTPTLVHAMYSWFMIGRRWERGRENAKMGLHCASVMLYGIRHDFLVVWMI